MGKFNSVFNIKGYHGTYPENIQNIKYSNFKESQNDTWYGDAVYFFVAGIGSMHPTYYARQYAIDSSWDKDLRQYIKNEYLVLEVDIHLNEDKLLDLTITNGAKLFNEYRDRYINRIIDTGIRINTKILDVHILNTMRKNLGIEFVKANVYIKFAMQRVQDFRSKIPNVTIFAVNNPNININKESIKEILKGKIK